MTNIIRKNLKASLSALAFFLATNPAGAQTCTVPPSCESLGFNKTAAECGKLATLKCPFDESKLFCTAYTDSNGNANMSIGDIVYTDGSYSTEPIANKKPIGVIFDIAGIAVATKTAGTANTDSSLQKLCTDYTDYNVSGWKLPNFYQLTAVYQNKTEINKTLAKIISASQLGNEEYAYIKSASADCVAGINFSTGKTGSIGCHQMNAQCILDIASLSTTPVVPTYTAGQSYTDASGIARGTVLSVDDSGKHGIVITNIPKTGTKGEASSYCDTYNAGTLNWYLPSIAQMEQACKLKASGFSSTAYHWVSDTTGYVYWSNCNAFTNSATSGNKTYFCVAPF